MIKFENTEVMNFEGAIRGMRNPMNSWCLSDSAFNCDLEYCDGCENCRYYSIGCDPVGDVYLGDNDLNLMKRLIDAGTDHRKFLRQIIVSVDITAPLYWWKEFDTYKVGTVANSCSTMHKIHEKEFTLDDFSCEYLVDQEEHADADCIGSWKTFFTDIITFLNWARIAYLKTNDKKYWWQMIQLLPSSYNQKRTVTLNYEVLRNIAESRKNHKLDEWSIGFMEWIDSLPYANVLLRS